MAGSIFAEAVCIFAMVVELVVGHSDVTKVIFPYHTDYRGVTRVRLMICRFCSMVIPGLGPQIGYACYLKRYAISPIVPSWDRTV